MLGRKGELPYPPGNLLGDFAGGGSMCFLGIMPALFERERSGLGQIVNANMVDGSAYLATSPRFTTKNKWWNRERGKNLLDGGCPWYGDYETKDGVFMVVEAKSLLVKLL
jgi:alpha-methylacyl-CoA racemase